MPSETKSAEQWYGKKEFKSIFQNQIRGQCLNTVGGQIKGPAIKGPFPNKMKWAFVP